MATGSPSGGGSQSLSPNLSNTVTQAVNQTGSYAGMLNSQAAGGYVPAGSNNATGGMTNPNSAGSGTYGGQSTQSGQAPNPYGNPVGQNPLAGPPTGWGNPIDPINPINPGNQPQLPGYVAPPQTGGLPPHGAIPGANNPLAGQPPNYNPPLYNPPNTTPPVYNPNAPNGTGTNNPTGIGNANYQAQNINLPLQYQNTRPGTIIGSGPSSYQNFNLNPNQITSNVGLGNNPLYQGLSLGQLGVNPTNANDFSNPATQSIIQLAHQQELDQVNALRQNFAQQGGGSLKGTPGSIGEAILRARMAPELVNAVGTFNQNQQGLALQNKGLDINNLGQLLNNSTSQRGLDITQAGNNANNLLQNKGLDVNNYSNILSSMLGNRNADISSFLGTGNLNFNIADANNKLLYEQQAQNAANALTANSQNNQYNLNQGQLNLGQSQLNNQAAQFTSSQKQQADQFAASQAFNKWLAENGYSTNGNGQGGSGGFVNGALSGAATGAGLAGLGGPFSAAGGAVIGGVIGGIGGLF